MAAARGFEETVSSGGKTKTNGSGALSAPASGEGGGGDQPSLGKALAAARDKRGLSRAEVAAQTHIPPHYLGMIESSDYGLIADQLYLMPFLRRYADFLGMDGEDVAMRFIREVQRAEGSAPVRLAEPLELKEGKRIRWGRVIVAVLVLTAIVLLYLIVSHRHSGHFAFRLAPPAASIAPLSRAPRGLAVAPAGPRNSEASVPVPETTVVAQPNAGELHARPPAAAAAQSAASSTRASGHTQSDSGHP